MLGKIIIALIGFGLGIFMLINSGIVLSKYLGNIKWVVTPVEQLCSFGFTAFTGIILIIWTSLIVKKTF